MKLKKVNIKSREDHATMTGGAHFHVFTNDLTGEELIERTTAEHHAMMKLPGGSFWNPKREGYTWITTFGTFEYDTPDGKLGEGQYAEDGGTAFCRFVGDVDFDIYDVPKDKIKNGEIEDSEVVKIKAEILKLKSMV